MSDNIVKVGKYEFNKLRRIGELNITLPDPPPLKEIEGYGKADHDQRFTPVKIPKGIDDRWQGYSDQDLTPEDDAFLKRESKRFKEGYWFMNNGFVEYITGNHYFYLNYWKIPVDSGGRKRLGLPRFKDSDRDYWYFWEHCKNDPYCAGMIFVTNRRDGKTYKGTSTLFFDTSRNSESHSGIQSKTGDDASQVFQKLVKSWQVLPAFLRPVDIGQSHPQKTLRFYDPPKKSTKDQAKQRVEALRSEIDYKNVKSEAYDGWGLLRYMMDEAGKNVEADVSETWNIVKETLVDGTTITGKALITTTVEDMEKKGGRNCKKIWVNSNPQERLSTGTTKSMLYRLFKPASYGLMGKDTKGVPFIDEYGYSDIERAEKYLRDRRKGLSGDDLAGERRRYPLDESDAFLESNDQSLFNQIKIQEQIEFNETFSKTPYVVGNLSWKDTGGREEVVFIPNEKGKWKIYQHPSEENRNRYIEEGGKKKPTGNIYFMGTDPYDHRFTVDNKKSDAASLVFRKADPLVEKSNCFVAMYLNRPPTPKIFYEDMVKQCVYFSGMMLVENNKPGLIEHFYERGYERYLMERPKSTETKQATDKSTTQKLKGVPLSGETARSALLDRLITYIEESVGMREDTGRMGNCVFNDLLEDWQKFEPQKWTDYDATVASGLALLAVGGSSKPPPPPISPFDIFPTFDISGNISRPLDGY